MSFLLPVQSLKYICVESACVRDVPIGLKCLCLSSIAADALSALTDMRTPCTFVLRLYQYSRTEQLSPTFLASWIPDVFFFRFIFSISENQ